MKKASGSLEDFFRGYMKNRALYDGADTYESYLRKKGENPSADYYGALTRLNTQLKRADSGYGVSGEKLAEMGLTGSGYGSYLRELAKNSYQSQRDSLERSSREKNDSLTGGYLSYLEKYKSSQDTLSRSIGEKIIRSKMLDEERAYRYAIDSGLSEARARSVAEISAKEAREELLRSIIADLPSMNLDGESAWSYAISLGLTKSEAERAKLYAESLKKASAGISGGYLDYLQNYN